MTETPVNAAPQGIRRIVEATLSAPTRDWRPLTGGRSNAIWTLRTGDEQVVCKLYRSARASILFPNDPQAETKALKALGGSGLAPELIDAVSSAEGQIVLYGYVAGCPLEMSVEGCRRVGRSLAALHGAETPEGLRKTGLSGASIDAQVRAICAPLDPETCAAVMKARPEVPDETPGAPVFLHGDPVPANMVQRDDGIVLIDWQCPAAGDPLEDLFVFLSPAMQALYGGRPLDDLQRQGLFVGYGAPAIKARHDRWAPALHWRMWAYCLSMAARGEADYAEAAALEKAALDRLEYRDGAAAE